VKVSVLVFCVETPCGLVGGYTGFGEAYCFRPEEGNSMFFQDVGIYLQVHTALQFRIPA
jgi:hypothetical protein